MPSLTKRDRLWLKLLEEISSGARKTTSQYLAELADVSERTARELLKALEDRGLADTERLPDNTVTYNLSGLIGQLESLED